MYLHIAQLSLNLLTSISVSHRQGIPTIQKTVLVSHSKREALRVVNQFMGNLTSSQRDYSLPLSLLAIGETDRGAYLSQLT